MYPHFPHVTPGSLAINANVIFPVQDIRHPTVTVLRMSRVNLIDDPLIRYSSSFAGTGL